MTVKCKVHATHHHLEHVFKIGDKVEIIPVYFKKDTVLRKSTILIDDSGRAIRDKIGRLRYVPHSKLVAKKGSVQKYLIKTADGQLWPEDIINQFLGYSKAYSDFFTIIKPNKDEKTKIN